MTTAPSAAPRSTPSKPAVGPEPRAHRRPSRASAPDLAPAPTTAAGPSEPLYRQIKALILQRIRAGDWAPGSRVPSENDLTRALGVSRMTANRALRELTDEGWLERVRGAGSFVAEAKPQGQALALDDIAAEIRRRGGRHEAEVEILRAERVGAGGPGLLGLAPGSRVFHSLILHRENGRPLLLEDRYVNPAVAPDYLAQDFAAGPTPTAYLVARAPMTAGEHVIEAVRPDAQACRLLETAPDEPCLLVRRRTWSGAAQVTVARLLFPGARYSLAGRLG